MSVALGEALFFVGVGWAAAEHAVCVMDEVGGIVVEFTIKHPAGGIARLVGRPAGCGEPERVLVAFECPGGRLVDLLLEAGHAVVAVKPNAIKTWREGEVLSGAESEAGDAAVIAGYLRLRQHRLQVLTPYSGQAKAVRTVVRTRDCLVEMRVMAINKLSARLEARWPGAEALFADGGSPISLEFLIRYPMAASAAHLGGRRMAAFCAKHSYSGRRSAAGLLARLRGAPSGTIDEVLHACDPRRCAGAWSPCSRP